MSTEDRVHHPYSPSTLQNLEACPCYLGRQSEKPHERTTAGTRAHKVTETLEDDHKLGDDDAVAVAECLDFYDQRRDIIEDIRMKEVVAECDRLAVAFDCHPDECAIDAESRIPKIVEVRETYLPIDDLEFEDGVKSTTAGYIDRGIIFKNRAELFDWKFGNWPVEKAENNLQGIAYSLGCFKAYPGMEWVTFHFFQPTLGTISSATFTKSQIAELYLRVQVVVARAREARKRGDFATANPMIPVCNFCSHIGVCPKVSAFSLKVASKFHPLEIPDDITPTKLHNTLDTLLCMRLAGVVKTWAESFRTQVTNRVLARRQDMPAGYILASRADREIVDPKKFESVALRFMTKEEFESAKTINFGPVEEVISDNAPRGSKKSTLESFKNNLEESGAVKKGDQYHFLKAVPVNLPQ
jgi:hypothetical protein